MMINLASQSFNLRKTYYPYQISASCDSRTRAKTAATTSTTAVQIIEDGTSKERIRKLFAKVEVSVSAYDTAWVAMVPNGDEYNNRPLFPECLDWLLNNQNDDGSWGSHPFLLKDTLSSTLASILALKQWGAAQHHISKGMEFMDLNLHLAVDKNHHSPIGFDIIFPGMLDYAKDLDLKFPLKPTLNETITHNRELELKRWYAREAHERDAYLAYVSEGIGKTQDWKMVMQYQRKNGSLFNSPATTAAALRHHLPSNSGLLNYIHLCLQKFGNAVPASYPLDIYVRLCMVDNLQRIGIARHFKSETQSVLEEAYSCWMKRDEEIFMDASTCAMAFRLLRSNGYDVSADLLIGTVEEHDCISSSCGHLKVISDTLEIYKASQITIYPPESNLRRHHSKSNHILRSALANNSFCSSDNLATYIRQEVDDGLKFPFYASLDRIESRRNIEHYSADCSVIRVLKSSYTSPNFGNKDFLQLAIEDFNFLQSIHREELKELERWTIERKLDELKFARRWEAFCYFCAVATFYTPELSDARITHTQNSILAVMVDDFFDNVGSPHEFLNLIQLVEKWTNVDLESDCCSKEVGIMFSAIHNATTNIADKAFLCQGRSVTAHLVKLWVDLLNSMFIEAEWTRNKYVPSIDEYIENAYVSFALGPVVLSSLYVVGEELSEEVVRSTEYNKMFRLMSYCGRILNDIQSNEVDTLQGKYNIVSLLMVHGGITKEVATDEARKMIRTSREELWSLVVKKGSVVPKACKELFWKVTKSLHLFYDYDNHMTSSDLKGAINDVIYKTL